MEAGTESSLQQLVSKFSAKFSAMAAECYMKHGDAKYWLGTNTNRNRTVYMDCASPCNMKRNVRQWESCILTRISDIFSFDVILQTSWRLELKQTPGNLILMKSLSLFFNKNILFHFCSSFNFKSRIIHNSRENLHENFGKSSSLSFIFAWRKAHFEDGSFPSIYTSTN